MPEKVDRTKKKVDQSVPYNQKTVVKNLTPQRKPVSDGDVETLRKPVSDGDVETQRKPVSDGDVET